MRAIRLFSPLALLTLLAGLALSGMARGQSTDGYFSMQVVPVVVDSASFTQRFTFENAQDQDLTLRIKYFPAAGTTGTAITCPNLFLNLGNQRTVAGLRTLCPALPVGSQFGFLTITDISANNPGLNVFSVYTRVSNAAGAGFSVEGFPATTFTSAWTTVTGLRRLAATANSPAFQTNCFFANMDRLDGDPPVSTSIHYNVYSTNGFLLGQGDLVLPAGGFVRYLDIFGQAGVPAGDVDNAWIRVNPTTFDGAGLITFCTVQDNTSFGADFRIAKMTVGATSMSGGQPSSGAKDILATRNVLVDHDAIDRAFAIPAGAFSNTHILYLRQPDFLRCELLNPTTGLRLTAAYGLEMRIADKVDESTLVGGNDQVAFPSPAQTIYIGDKPDSDSAANANPILEVESNGQNTAAIRPYRIHCVTGNGATGLEMIRYQEPIVRF